MNRFRKMILVVMTMLIILIFGLYALAPHPPAMPEQVLDATELETYLNRLVQATHPD